MSQEKVERYKKSKANRKETVKKGRMKAKLGRLVGAVICIALIAWIGYSGYLKISDIQNSTATEITTDALTNYISDLSAE